MGYTAVASRSGRGFGQPLIAAAPIPILEGMAEDLARIADEELARRVLAGDDAAARVLYERHEPLLRARARRRLVGGLSRKVGASDIVQETYLAAFADLSAFEDRGPGSFRRWLEAVLEFRAKDEVRRHLGTEKRSVRREISRDPAISDSGPVSPGTSPSAEAAAAEERAALADAIDAMEGDDRTVLRLVHLEGRDFEEAGRELSRSAEAARKLYARAVLRLGKRLRGSP